MNKKLAVFMLLVLSCFTCIVNYCNAGQKKTVSPYKSVDEWKAAFKMDEYVPNKEITTGEYDKKLAVKCKNGIFVGTKQDDVISWKGIPYALQPVGERRFKRAIDPLPSTKVYEAYYFAPSCMQPLDPDGEASSLYKQSEECLNLNIWVNSTSKNKKKPVLVYIHGGGWLYGGTVDPLYNGQFFVQNNPDIILVTVTYRMGMMGMINLSSFPDSKEYETSINNGILDLVQSLKWLKDNISAFGGNPKNITISGESAGGGAASTLCTLKYEHANELFSKAILMSGSVNQGSDMKKTFDLPEALKKDFGVKTVYDIQKIDFETLQKYWNDNASKLYSLSVRDGKFISKDPFELWEKGASKGLTIMQGHTADEFLYFEHAFNDDEAMFNALCEVAMEDDEKDSSDEFKENLKEYKKALLDLGYPEKEIPRRYMDDKTLSIGNTYQAMEHAKNGGKGYCYTFEKCYDYPKYLRAAHAIDCYYLFGTFDGVKAFGTKDEVDLALKYQKMIANFAKTGNPSTKEYNWPKYNNKTRIKMMIGDNMRIENNPEKDRVNAAVKMMKSEKKFRYVNSFSEHIAGVKQKYPEVYENFVKKALEKKEALKNENKNNN